MRTPNKVTGANAGGRRQLPVRARQAARVAQFCRSGRRLRAERSYAINNSSPSSKAQSAPNAATRLRDLIHGYWIAQCIAVAAKLGIADLLKSGPKSVDDLAAITGTQARPLYRLLRALASFDIFAEGTDGRIHLSPMAGLLETSPHSFRAFAILMGEEEFHRAWDALLHSLKTGHPAFNHVYGKSYWEYLSGHPAAAAIFNAGLAGWTSQVAQAVVGAYDFSPFRKLVDVGGGHGVLLAAILGASPSLAGTLFDLPHAMDGARKTMESARLAARCEFVSGDFFKSVPDGGDAYLLCQVIHDWNDDRALAILRNCRQAMKSSGRLLLVERVIPLGNEPFYGKLLDVHMLVATDEGTDRTESEYRDLIERAGFASIRIIPSSSDVSIIEAASA